MLERFGSVTCALVSDCTNLRLSGRHIRMTNCARIPSTNYTPLGKKLNQAVLQSYSSCFASTITIGLSSRLISLLRLITTVILLMAGFLHGCSFYKTLAGFHGFPDLSEGTPLPHGTNAMDTIAGSSWPTLWSNLYLGICAGRRKSRNYPHLLGNQAHGLPTGLCMSRNSLPFYHMFIHLNFSFPFRCFRRRSSGMTTVNHSMLTSTT